MHNTYIDNTAMINKNEKTSRYEYFNPQGKLIGESEGAQPDQKLLDQAHYAVRDSEKMIKNEDSTQTISADIAAFRKELLKTPVSNMAEIMHLNKIIEQLTAYLSSDKAA